MNRLGIDVGLSFVGVAFAPAVPPVAVPLAVFKRGGGEAERAILAVVTEKTIGELVVGLPLDEHGRRTEQCEDVERFCRRLLRRCSVGLVFVDEYLSSVEAVEELGWSGRKGRGRGLRREDASAAAILLQGFLEGRLVGIGGLSD